MQVYLDYAAATPMDNEVRTAMEPFYDEHFYNPSAIYQPALTARKLLEDARSDVAVQIGVRPAEVVFTAGGTEANNLAIQGVMRAFPGRHLVYTSLEHDSILHPAQYLARNGWNATEVNPHANGIIDAEKIIELITDDTVLVTLMLANNEVGTIQPVKQVTEAVETIRKQRLKQGNETPLYVHTDACQAVNYIDVNMHRLGVDLMTLNGGKIYGPKQSGILAIRSHVQIEPLLLGGGQESGRRSGTQNVAHAVGFARALHKTAELRQSEAKRLFGLQTTFIKQLEDSFPRIVINGSRKYRLPNNVHITIPGMDNERLLFTLDDRGIQVATGSACSASKAESSHVLLGMGLSDAAAHSSIRMTFGRQTTQEQLDHVIEQLQDLL